MPINKETIISVFDDELTLMQWLKTINKALEDAVLTGVEITKKGNATLSFKFTFEDGTFLETNDIVLQQGESVNGAYIQNGHLYLTLTNSQTLDAGNVKPVSSFSIDANQHLVVNYGDGTSQDLGAIFQGNVNISGTLNATKVTGDEIVENMAGYTFEGSEKTNINCNIAYAGVVKNGNKITFAIAGTIERTGEIDGGDYKLGYFTIPVDIANKLFPLRSSWLSMTKLYLGEDYSHGVEVPLLIYKSYDVNVHFNIYDFNNCPTDTNYAFRAEATFLLSDNLAQ